jgi:hypothetical protein
VKEIIRRGLEDSGGNYKIVARNFNMDPGDYKRFLNFLRKHHCQLAVQAVSLIRASTRAARHDVTNIRGELARGLARDPRRLDRIRGRSASPALDARSLLP